MTDAELRGCLLTHFYDLRHSNGGDVPVSNVILSGDEYVTDDVVRNICWQLSTAGLIVWHPYLAGPTVGLARITAPGVDCVEGTRSPNINIQLPGLAVIPVKADTSAQAPPPASGTPTSGPTNGEMFTLKPTVWGISVDLKQVFHWARRKWGRSQ